MLVPQSPGIRTEIFLEIQSDASPSTSNYVVLKQMGSFFFMFFSFSI